PAGGPRIGLLELDLAPTSAPPSQEALAAIGRIVASALSHVRTIERLAGTSRRAHALSQERGRALNEIAGATIVAESPAMRRIFEVAIPTVANVHTTVVIQGETG